MQVQALTGVVLVVNLQRAYSNSESDDAEMQNKFLDIYKAH